MNISKQGAAERVRRYFELRDAGVRATDAAREVGVQESTGRRYERQWKAARQAPRSRSMMRFDW